MSGGSSSRPAEQTPLGPELGLYVAGDDELALALRQELATRLRTDGAFGNVTSLSAPPARGSGRALLVEVEGGRGTWTPVYARARLTAKLAYASDGDVSLHREPSVLVIGADQPVIRVMGDLQVDDVTWGLTSRLAYQRHLGRRIGADVGEALRQALQNNASVG